MSILTLWESQPGVTVPEIEVKLSPPTAAYMLSHWRDMQVGQQLSSEFNVAWTYFHLAAEHLAPAKQFDLILSGAGSRRFHLLQKKLKGLVAKTTVKRSIDRTHAFLDHVVAHAADTLARMPKRNRNTGTEQSGYPRIPPTEVKLSRVKEDFLKPLDNLLHGLR